MKCKRCGEKKIIKNGKKDKKQNYLCKGCGHQFISEHGKHTKHEEKLAVLLYCLGLSLTAIGKILHYHTSTIMRWIRRYTQTNCVKSIPTGEIVIELEEMWDYIRSKKINVGFEKHNWVYSPEKINHRNSDQV